MSEIRLTNKEKEIVRKLNHKLYTVKHLEKWLNSDACMVVISGMDAISSAGALGYYAAVKKMAELE